MCSCSHRRRFALQLLLLFQLVHGSWLIGCSDSLLCPVVQQFVEVVGERASLVVAVVGLNLSQSCDWLRGRSGRGERRLTGGRLGRGGAEGRPWKNTRFKSLHHGENRTTDDPFKKVLVRLCNTAAKSHIQDLQRNYTQMECLICKQ